MNDSIKDPEVTLEEANRVKLEVELKSFEKWQKDVQRYNWYEAENAKREEDDE